MALWKHSLNRQLGATRLPHRTQKQKDKECQAVKESVAGHQTGAARFAAQGSEKENVHWEDQIIVYVQIP